MHKAVLYAKLVFVAAIGGTAALYSQRWNAEAATGLFLTIAVVAALLGFGPQYLAALLLPKLRAQMTHDVGLAAAAASAEHEARTAELTNVVVAELDAMRLEIRRSINNARSEGQLDGVLAERLGRTAGEPPRPHRTIRQRPFDRLSDSGSNHLRPVKD
jgi:hypothetical protein